MWLDKVLSFNFDSAMIHSLQFPYDFAEYGYLLDATRYNRLWFDQGCERRWADLHCLLSQSIE